MDVSGPRWMAGIVVFLVASHAPAQRMERGAFLRRPAASRQQLVNQVRQDPIVAARYSRHWKAKPAEVARYFGSLRTARTNKTMRYPVWHVEKDGTLRAKHLTLKKGTPVFVDTQGRYVLKASCGNPLVTSIPRPTESRRPQPLVFAPNEPEPVPPEALVVEPDLPQVEAVVPPPSLPPEVPAEIPPFEIVPVVPAAPVVPPAAAFPLGPAVFFPTILTTLSGGSGGGGVGVSVIPGPASALVFGLGIALRRRGQARRSGMGRTTR